MKYIALFAISIYQLFISPLLKTILGTNRMCRFTPSCSEYAKQQIQKHGIIRGSWLGFVRLLQCQPYIKIKDQKLNLKNTKKKLKPFHL